MSTKFERIASIVIVAASIVWAFAFAPTRPTIPTAEIVVRTECGPNVNSTTVTVTDAGTWRAAIVQALRDNAVELEQQGCASSANEMRSLADRIEAHQ